MKYIIFLMLASTFFSCKKTTTENCFTVKIVTGICADYVVQIQDPAYQGYGEDQWLNPADNQYYDNVFMVQNYCTNADAINTAMRNGGTSFKVKIVANESMGNCVTCLAILTNRPNKILAVKPCD